jgi:hypothetical protein
MALGAAAAEELPGTFFTFSFSFSNWRQSKQLLMSHQSSGIGAKLQ